MTTSMLARLEGFVLLGVAVVALAFQLWLPSTHVAEADYQAVAQVLAAERQPGDVVLLAPWWTERARLYVPDGLPVVGYQGSDGDPLEKHPRVWVLSQPRQPRAGLGEFEARFAPQRSAVGPARTFGNLTLQLFQNGRARPVVFDAADAFRTAQVALETPDGNVQPCAPQGNGFRCANGRTVTRELREVHFAPYTCLKLEAPGGATRVAATFTVPTEAASSVLGAGYIWEYGACRDCTPTQVSLSVNGNPAQQLTLAPGDETMHRLEGPPLPAGAQVKLAVASQNPNARVVCVTFTGQGKVP